MATAIAETTETKSNNPVAVFRQTLQTMQPELKMALPAHIPPEKYARVAQTAINNSPDLLNCDRRSLLGAIVRLAQDGLLPDGREAALVKFRTKEGGTYIDKVQAMPMIYGILKKLRQSGEVAKVSAQVVYENDTFVQRLGFDEDVEHVPPPLGTDRGKPIGAYATAVLKDGSKLLEVMDINQIERVRGVSKAKDNQYGPWVNWWEEMARKTVMRRLSKRLPMSTDLYEEITRDDTLTNVDAPQQQIEHQPTHHLTRLDALEHQIHPSPAADGSDGADAGSSTAAIDPEAPPSGLEDEGAGELVTLASAIAEIDAAETVIDVNMRAAALRQHLDEAQADELMSHAAARVHEMKQGAE